MPRLAWCSLASHLLLWCVADEALRRNSDRQPVSPPVSPVRSIKSAPADRDLAAEALEVEARALQVQEAAAARRAAQEAEAKYAAEARSHSLTVQRAAETEARAVEAEARAAEVAAVMGAQVAALQEQLREALAARERGERERREAHALAVQQ